MQAPIFDAPDPARVVVTIHNSGPGTGSGVLHFRYNATDQPLTGDQRSEQTFNTTEPIPPDTTVNFTLPWEPAEDQVGPGVIIVTLDSPSDTTSGNNRLRSTVFVQRYELDADLVDVDGHETLPGRTTPYRINVTNTGNSPFRLDTSTVEAPEGWIVEGAVPSLAVGPWRSQTIVVLVTPPEQAPNGDEGAAVARIATVENPNAGIDIELPTTVVVEAPDPPFEYGLEARADRTVVPVTPGGPATEVLVELTNTGNVADAYNLTVAVSGALASQLEASTPVEIIALNASQSALVPVLVELTGPDEASRTSTVTIRTASVNAAVFEPDATSEMELEVRIAAPDLVVTDLHQIGTAYRHGGPAQVEATVVNQGQSPAPATNLTLSVERSGFGFESVDGRAPALQPGGSSRVALSVPTSNLTGEYVLRARVDPTEVVPENVETNNERGGTLFVRTSGLVVRPATPLDVQPGQFVRYERPPHVFDVQNLGNAREAVHVVIESEAGWFDSTTVLHVPPGGRRPVPISFTVPDLPGRETDTLTVHASLVNMTSVRASNQTTTLVVDRAAPEMLDVHFPSDVTATEPFTIVTAWEDAVGVAGVTLELTSPTNVTRRHEMRRTAAGVFEANLTVYELGTYGFTLEAVDSSSFANLFTHEIPFEFDAAYNRTPLVVFASDPANRTIRAGTPIRVTAEDPAGVTAVRFDIDGETGRIVEPFEIPTRNLRTGPHNVTVVASNRYGLEATASATFTIDNEPPEIHAFTIRPEDPEPGDRIRFQLELGPDATRARVELQGDDGFRGTVHMTPVADGVFEALTTLPAGEFTASAVAFDAAGNAAAAEMTVDVGARGLPSPGVWVTLFVVTTLAAFTRREARRGR